MSKRVLAMALAILAIFLFVGSPFQQAAYALVGVDDALITILIAALAAIGITFVTSGAFLSTQEYVSNLLEQYAASQGVSVGSLFNGVDSGVNKQGKLLLNNRFVRLLDSFATWIVVELGLVNNAQKQLQQGGYFVGDFVSYKLPIFSTTYYPSSQVKVTENLITGAAEVYCILVYESTGSNTFRFDYVLVSNRNTYAVFNWARYRNQAATNLESSGSNVHYLTKDDYNGPGGINISNAQLYYAVINSSTQSYLNNPNSSNWQINIENPVYYTPDEISQALSGTLVDLVTQEAISVNTGQVIPPSEDGNYNPGDGAILDVGAQWGEGYIDITDNTIPDAFEDENVGDATITYEDEEVVEEQVEESQSNAQPVSQEANDYQVTGLASVFPFCIPFDIYAFFECLAAEPVAPSFSWRFYIPGICDEQITIDLQEFDSAAMILRTMELLLFIVGLAFVTRDKFIRG